MPEFEITAPGGRTFRVTAPEGTTAEQALERVKAQAGQETAETPTSAPSAGSSATTPAMTRTPYGLPAIPDPLSVAGKGLSVLRAPLKAAFDLAGRADVASGIKTPEQAASRANTYSNIPIPLAVGALTGGASLPAQAIIQAGTTAAMQEGGLEPKSPAQVALAGASPFLAAGIGRLARAVPRSLTRMIPSRFAGAQEAAQEAGENIARGFEPPSSEATGELWKAARQAGAEPIRADKLTAMLSSLEESIPKNPTSAGLKTTRELMDAAREAIRPNGTVDLGELMKLRLDVGRSMAKAPEVGALYRGIIGDLEMAGASGAGADLALKALEMSRKAHGAETLRGLIERSSRTTNLAPGEKLLDIAKLTKLVGENKDELVKQLGHEGVSQIENFLFKYRGLPPAQAYTWANKIAGMGAAGLGLGGATGMAVPGVIPALAGGLGYELINNAIAVGKNPVELNRALIMLGAGARAGMAGTAKEAVESKR